MEVTVAEEKNYGRIHPPRRLFPGDCGKPWQLDGRIRAWSERHRAAKYSEFERPGASRTVGDQHSDDRQLEREHLTRIAALRDAAHAAESTGIGAGRRARRERE